VRRTDGYASAKSFIFLDLAKTEHSKLDIYNNQEVLI
jgi:hypothetical protein